MKINPKYRLEQATSKDETRTTLCQINITRKHAVATDGHILAVVPVTEAGKTETFGLIKPEALVTARKVSKKLKLSDTEFTLTKKHVSLSDGSTLARAETEETFPNIGNILHNASQNDGYVFSINVEKLHALADALGDETLTLFCPKDTNTRAIFVRPAKDAGYEKAYGVIMPVRTPEEFEPKKEAKPQEAESTEPF